MVVLTSIEQRVPVHGRGRWLAAALLAVLVGRSLACHSALVCTGTSSSDLCIRTASPCSALLKPGGVGRHNNGWWPPDESEPPPRACPQRRGGGGSKSIVCAVVQGLGFVEVMRAHDRYQS